MLLAGDAAHVHYPAGGQGLDFVVQSLADWQEYLQEGASFATEVAEK